MDRGGGVEKGKAPESDRAVGFMQIPQKKKDIEAQWMKMEVPHCVCTVRHTDEEMGFNYID